MKIIIHPSSVEESLIESVSAIKVENKPFTKRQLATMQAQYGRIKTIDPDSPTYQRLIDMLDSLNQAQLKQLSDARIPFLGSLARNRLKR